MSCKLYTINLTNGEMIEYQERADVPWEYSLMRRFMKAAAKHVFSVPNLSSARIYIPKRSIAYITNDGESPEDE